MRVIREAVRKAGVRIEDLDCMAYTKGKSSDGDRRRTRMLTKTGPGMGTPLQVGALVARTLSLLHNIPLIGVNHCVGREYLITIPAMKS